MNAFKIFDDKETGFIELCKLRDIIHNIGKTWGDEKINLFIKQADIEGNGMVNHEEFTSLMLKDKSPKYRLHRHDNIF